MQLRIMQEYFRGLERIIIHPKFKKSETHTQMYENAYV